MSGKGDVPDELFDLKVAFYLGNYQQAINEAQKLRVSFLFYYYYVQNQAKMTQQNIF